MNILPSCSHVVTIVYMHPLDFNEVPGEKKKKRTRLEQHKDTVNAC